MTHSTGKAINSEVELAIKLRYVATVETYTSLMYGFYIVHSTTLKTLRELREAIVAENAEEVMNCLRTLDQ